MRTIPGHPGRLTRASSAWQLLYRGIGGCSFLPSFATYNLTISHERRFVWFRVAKAGTRTILHHFHQHGVHLDAAHPSWVYYPPRAYARYFKFAIVRNPWDRLVSCWVEKVVNNSSRYQFDGHQFDEAQRERLRRFEHFVEFVVGLDLEACDRHLRLQCKLIDLGNLDYLGRIETFNEDFGAICRRLGIPDADVVPRNASSDRKPYQTYYSDALRDAVHRAYRKDIQIFGYRF